MAISTLARTLASSNVIRLVLVLLVGAAIWRMWSDRAGAQDMQCRRGRSALVDSPGDALLDAFPRSGTDTAPSLGLFRLSIAPEFQQLLAGMPGYDTATGNLDSPVMYDPETTIWRSAPHKNGSPQDDEGVPVGDGEFEVSDSDFVIVPDPAGFPDVVGAREIHTAIKRFELKGEFAGVPVVTVRAGTDYPDLLLSPGEVRSIDDRGNPLYDLPGMSFFNVYVEVDLPRNPTQPLAFPGATVYNDEPLLVENRNVTFLPPRVVYTHEGPVAVAVRFKEDNEDHWSAGDVLGFLTLAGHGMCFYDTSAERETLEGMLRWQRGMPTPTWTPTYTPTPAPTQTPTSTPTVTLTPTTTSTPTPSPMPAFLPLALDEQCYNSEYVSLVLVLDTSSSMAGDPITKARQAAGGLVDLLADDYGFRVALVTFHGEAALRVGLTADRSLVHSALRELQVTGTGTAIDSALRIAIDELARDDPSWSPAVVLMSDGQQTGGPERALAAGEEARRAGIPVYTVALGVNADAATLRAIAGADDRFFTSPTPDELRHVFEVLGQSIRCHGQTFWP